MIMNDKFHTSMILFVIGLVAFFSLLTVFELTSMPPLIDPCPPGPGLCKANSLTHQHATILVKIFGDKFDFGHSDYHLASYWINFEKPYDDIIHIHDRQVTLGYLFETLNIKVTEDCYIFPEGRDFCTDENYSLKYFVNGNQVSSINRYDINDGDRILISYGPETQEEIEQQLEELNSYPLTIIDREHLLRK